ncbi:MAG: hypothetical protein IJ705_07755, partial [Oscillospiraceae bacterium]|nr:hypothetical protein [Oscillospiraceae bacterium]
DENLARREMEEALRDTLLRSVGVGEVLEAHFSAAARGDTLSVCLRARCEESIGVERPAETIQK